MNNSEFFEAVRLLSKEKNVSESALLEGIQRAIVTAVKRDYNNKDIVFCEIDEQDKKIRVFVRKNVVGEITDPDEDITVEQAQRFKKNAVAGDITAAMPYRAMMNIINFIQAVDHVVPGFASRETLLYSPELKFYSNRVKMDKDFNTSVAGLHCLGDSSGWTRGLMMASVMGVLMGRHLAEKG